jgi:hypothetical protein
MIFALSSIELASQASNLLAHSARYRFARDILPDKFGIFSLSIETMFARVVKRRKNSRFDHGAQEERFEILFELMAFCPAHTNPQPKRQKCRRDREPPTRVFGHD